MSVAAKLDRNTNAIREEKIAAKERKERKKTPLKIWAHLDRSGFP